METLIENAKHFSFDKKHIRFCLYALIVIILLELTVFNYKFYANYSNQSIVKSVEADGSIKTLKDNRYYILKGDKSLEISNINEHIKNIYIDMEIEGNKNIVNNKYIRVVISATDDGNSEYFNLPERGIVYNQIQTKCIPLNLNGTTEKLKINIINCDEKIIKVNKIALNIKIPFEFNFIRVLFLFAAAVIIYIIKPGSGFYKFRFRAESKKQSYIVLAIAAINIAAVIFLGFAHPSGGISSKSYHNQYNWLAEAIMDGHFYLNEEPPQSLIDMDNPYDRKLRDKVVEEADEDYKWDTAYYNGKYYVYFGVVPELLFFLPAQLFGVVLINKGPVLVMTMFAMVFGYLLIRELTRRWFSDTSFLLYLILSVVFVNSMGVLMAVKVPDLYMIPISHALAFSVAGLYLWIRALPYNNDEKLKGGYLFAGSVCMALVAGCRPQVVLASFLAVPLLWDSVFKKRELFSKTSILKSIGFIAPYIVTAAFIMYYNYARFGNVLDFGANYNLTVMDMVSEKFSIAKIPLGLYTYFLQPPYMIAKFPFLQHVDIQKDFMGNYVMEQIFGGLFPCHIILMSLLLMFKVKSGIKEKKLWIPLIIMIALSLVISVIDFNTGGLVLRYFIDFAWFLFLAAVIVVYAVYEKYKGTDYGNIFVKFVSVSFVWSMAYNFMLLFNEGTATYKYNIPQLFYFVKHAIEFWI